MSAYTVRVDAGGQDRLEGDLECVQVHPAGPEVEAVYRIALACAEDLAVRFGDGHWGQARSLAEVRSHARRTSVFAAKLHGEVVGTFALSQQQPSFFDLQRFLKPRARAVYLSAMFVDPRLQRRGVGRWMLAQAEQIALSWGCEAIRLDAYDAPAGAGGFYEKCGFQPRGKKRVMDIPLIIYEKPLTPGQRPGP